MFRDAARSYAKPAPSPQRNGYFARNLLINLIFRIIDLSLTLILPRNSKAKPLVDAKRVKILIANGAHLGDVVLSTYIIQRLKKMYPTSTIGVLVGSWSFAVIDGHPAVDHVHIVDHWRLNRSSKSLRAKIKQYGFTRTRALAQIKAVEYDVAIDLYCFFPNSIYLLFKSGIPRRIGFNSAGLGPLLTDSVDWRCGYGSMVDYFNLLVDRLGGQIANHPASFNSKMPGQLAVSPIAVQLPRPNVVLHLGTGGALKEWPVSSWRELATRLIADGYYLVFTGAGRDEREKIDLVIDGLKNTVNFCDKLSWAEFVAVIRDCDILVGVDSVAGHIAAAFDTSSITLSNGIHDPELWKPQSDACTVVRHQVACFPCYRSKGCEAMACIKLIDPEEVRLWVRKKHPHEHPDVSLRI